MPFSWLDAELQPELTELEGRNRLRSCPTVLEAAGTTVCLTGAPPATSFCSNDYLGLAFHPELADAAQISHRRSGAGPGASRLVSGERQEHRDLELALAEFLHHEAALVFPSGYQANIGAITALAGPNALVVSDSLNHASIIDGCRLSRAQIAIYRHCDAEAARTALRTPPSSGTPFRRKILVTESVFSMDGDIAPLRDLAAVCAETQAVLMVDEAHALGALGPQGRGVCAATNVAATVRIGTLSKALGSAGGFVASSTTVRSYLVNRARSFMFTTALAPSLAASALAALEITKSVRGDVLRSRLLDRISQLHSGLGISRPATPIVPFILGSDAAALAAAQDLRAAGLFVQPIRPPTVPEGTARLRLTLSAAHEPQDVERLLTSLSSLQRLPPQRTRTSTFQ